MLYLVNTKLTSTSGVALERAAENADCCLENSIAASEDGRSTRWPRVNRNGGCSGGIRRTLQEWVDSTVSDYKNYGWGLCYEGWRYVVRGTLIKTKVQFKCSKLYFQAL